MLERLRSERRWQWGAYGKHPAAKDYFTLGQTFPLLNSFSGWIEKGYQVMASMNNPGESLRAWRLWTREARRENIVCGFLRDSQDSLGRPYPLLILGSGPLKNWPGQWDLVPLACDATWKHMESIALAPFRDLRALEEEVLNLNPPSGEWLELARKRESFGERDVYISELRGRAPDVSEKMECFIPMSQLSPRDHFELVGLYHSFVRASSEALPNAIFTGGTTEKQYLAVFRRPLAQSDFIRLWSVTSASQSNGEP